MRLQGALVGSMMVVVMVAPIAAAENDLLPDLREGEVAGDGPDSGPGPMQVVLAYTSEGEFVVLRGLGLLSLTDVWSLEIVLENDVQPVESFDLQLTLTDGTHHAVEVPRSSLSADSRLYVVDELPGLVKEITLSAPASLVPVVIHNLMTLDEMGAASSSGYRAPNQGSQCSRTMNYREQDINDSGSDPERDPQGQINSGNNEGFYTMGGRKMGWNLGSICDNGSNKQIRDYEPVAEFQFDYYGDYKLSPGYTARATTFGLKGGVNTESDVSCHNYGGYTGTVCNGYKMKVDKVQAFLEVGSLSAEPRTAASLGYDHEGITCSTYDLGSVFDLILGVAGEFVPGAGGAWALLSTFVPDKNCGANSQQIDSPDIWTTMVGKGLQINTDSTAKDTKYAGDITFRHPTTEGEVPFRHVSNINIEIEYHYQKCNCGWSKYDYIYGFKSTGYVLVRA